MANSPQEKCSICGSPDHKHLHCYGTPAQRTSNLVSSGDALDPTCRCAECGMRTHDAGEYHPYAACLMFKACGDRETVLANLNAVLEAGKSSRVETTGRQRCGWFGEGRGQCLLWEGHKETDHTCEQDGRQLRIALTGLAAVREMEQRRAEEPEQARASL